MKSDEDIVHDLMEASIQTAQHLIQCVDEEIAGMVEEDGINWLDGFNITDEQYGEARDMYVLVNLLHATFTRFIGIPHELHKDIDNLYIKLKAIEAIQKTGLDNDIT